MEFVMKFKIFHLIYQTKPKKSSVGSKTCQYWYSPRSALEFGCSLQW
jgi:hypothetical protein